MPELGGNAGLDVGIDDLPSDRVNLLQPEILVGARRDRLKPLGLRSNYVGEKSDFGNRRWLKSVEIP